MIMETKKNNPKVSIIIPVYNGSNYIQKAIDSALAQTYDNMEVIVVNDGSTDNTSQIVKAYGGKVRYYEKENGGVSTALNLGIKKMSGDYFSWLSHDDEYKPEKIASQIELLALKKFGKRIALCDTEFIDKDSKHLDKVWGTPCSGDYTPEQALQLLIKKSFSGTALLIPREAFLECGNFNTSLRYIQDTDLWRRFFLNGFSLTVDKTIYTRSRLHDAQQTNRQIKLFIQEMELISTPFFDSLYQKKYYTEAELFLHSLEKYGIWNSVNSIKGVLRSNHQLTVKIKIKSMIYSFYGKIRPYIRAVYYKMKFNISVKK